MQKMTNSTILFNQRQYLQKWRFDGYFKLCTPIKISAWFKARHLEIASFG